MFASNQSRTEVSRKVMLVVGVDTWGTESSHIGSKIVRVSSRGTEVVEQAPLLPADSGPQRETKKSLNQINITVTNRSPDLLVLCLYTVWHTVLVFIYGKIFFKLKLQTELMSVYIIRPKEWLFFL